MTLSENQIGEVITGISKRLDNDLLSTSADLIAAEWYWHWDKGQSVEWNTYKFSDILEMHKRRWRRWEEHHNGSFCVVERVRDKYVMPRVREFLDALARHQAAKEPTNG